MSRMYTFFIVSIVFLTNLHAIYAKQHIFENYGVSQETSQRLLDLYLNGTRKSYEASRPGYTLTEHNTQRFMETLVSGLYISFMRRRNISMYTPREFIHYMILNKKDLDCQAEKSLYDDFLNCYKNALNKYYKLVTMIDLSKIPNQSIANKFYITQVLVNFSVYNSLYGDSPDRMIKIDEFLKILIKYAKENKNKSLVWDESLRNIINAEAEQRKLRFMERPTYKVIKKEGIDVIVMINPNANQHPIPTRTNTYFNIHLGDYFLFINLYNSEISEYFEKIHGKEISELPEEELLKTTKSYVKERYAEFCAHRKTACSILNINSYIIYLMFSRQIKSVPEHILLTFIEAFKDELNSFYKNITFTSLPIDKMDPFYSQRLLFNLNMYNAPRLVSKAIILNLEQFLTKHMMDKKEKNQNHNKVSVEKKEINGVNNSFDVTNETFDSLKKLYKNDIQDYIQRVSNIKRPSSDADDRDITESFVMYEYSDFCKYYKISEFTPKEYINFLVLQRTVQGLKEFNLFGTAVQYDEIVTSDHMSQFLKFYQEDLISYYKNLINDDPTEDKMKEFYKTQLMLYFNILNSFMNENEPKINMDDFIALVVSDAERNNLPNLNEISSNQKKLLTWNESGPRIIQLEIAKKKIIPADTDVKKKRKLKDTEDIVKEKKRKNQKDGQS